VGTIYTNLGAKESIFCSEKSVGLINGTKRFKKHKQLFEYQHLLLLRDIWWSKF